MNTPSEVQQQEDMYGMAENARPHTTGRCITTQYSNPVRPRTDGEKQTRPPVCPTKNAASPQTRTDRAVYERWVIIKLCCY